MQFSSLFFLLATATAIDTNHLTLALNLAKKQGTDVSETAQEESASLDKRGFLLLSLLKYKWATKMASYNVCYQCGGSICGSLCCSCGSSTSYSCKKCKTAQRKP